MELWTEMRTAMIVGRLGTVRSAAESLGVHRATVSRHIDTLEDRLGVRLFLRHKDGYSLTDDGHAMMGAAEKAERAIDDFTHRLQIQATELEGTLKVSAVSRAGPVIRAATQLFGEAHPRAKVHFDATTKLPQLEKGEAHIAVRAGRKPTNPDYVVIKYFSFAIAMYGHRDYLQKIGYPERPADLAKFQFVGEAAGFGDYELSPSVSEHLNAERISLNSGDPTIIFDGIIGGMGLGLASKAEASEIPQLVEVLPRHTTTSADVWIVTHVDAHRSPLIQEFISCLKAVRPVQEQVRLIRATL